MKVTEEDLYRWQVVSNNTPSFKEILLEVTQGIKDMYSLERKSYYRIVQPRPKVIRTIHATLSVPMPVSADRVVSFIEELKDTAEMYPNSSIDFCEEDITFFEDTEIEKTPEEYNKEAEQQRLLIEKNDRIRKHNEIIDVLEQQYKEMFNKS